MHLLVSAAISVRGGEIRREVNKPTTTMSLFTAWVGGGWVLQANRNELLAKDLSAANPSVERRSLLSRRIYT